MIILDFLLILFLLRRVDAVIITHLHTDHFDNEAKNLIPKDLPVFVQNNFDKSELITAGFKDVTVLSEKTKFKNITLIKTPGRHGYNEEIYNALGDVCGIVMISDNEMKTYIAGDTVWYEAVERTLLLHKPEFIILNAGANSVYTEKLIMGKEEVKKTHETLADALLLATHMEGVNHWTLSRQELRDFSIEHGFSEQLYIPFDGESILLNK